MHKEIKIAISPLTNGILGTNELDEQTYYQQPMEAMEAIINSNSLSKFLEEINTAVKYDIILSVNSQDGIDNKVEEVEQTEQERLEEIRITKESILARDKYTYNPLPIVQIDENQLRLSVNEKNAYSPEKLKSIDFKKLLSEFEITNKKAAELVGSKEPSMYQVLRKVKMGNTDYSFKSTRVKLTIIAKYIEAISGIRNTKKEELDRIREVLLGEIEKLNLIIKENNHIHSDRLKPFRATLMSLVQ